LEQQHWCRQLQLRRRLLAEQILGTIQQKHHQQYLESGPYLKRRQLRGTSLNFLNDSGFSTSNNVCMNLTLHW
jgi:hypothetical protein